MNQGNVPNQPGGMIWPGPATNPTNPGQPAANPIWSGSASGTNPAWPGGQPAANPMWPGGSSGTNPMWPGGSSGTNPMWPGGQPAPNPTWPGGQSGGGGPWPSPAPGFPSLPNQNLKVPFTQNLPNGVYDKMLITIVGTVKPNAEMFTVDLTTAKDLAFHFNPRFNDHGQKLIVRNSCIAGCWGAEEKDLQAFPFVPGQPFEMKILCTNTEFKVAVNNTHLLEYRHRITDLRSIKTVGVYKDLTLSRVHVGTLQ